MGVIVPAGYGQAAFMFQLTGKLDPIICTLGFNHGGDFATDADAQAIYTAWVGSAKLFHASLIPTGWSFQGIKITSQLLGEPVTSEYIVPVTGSASISTLPPNCAQLIRKATARGGRKGRGRWFFPPILIGEGGVNAAGDIDPSSMTDWNTRLGAAVAEMTANGVTPVLLHEDGSEPNTITGMTLQGRIATQRRRLR